jgi:hypothetical protein
MRGFLSVTYDHGPLDRNWCLDMAHLKDGSKRVVSISLHHSPFLGSQRETLVGLLLSVAWCVVLTAGLVSGGFAARWAGGRAGGVIAFGARVEQAGLRKACNCKEHVTPQLRTAAKVGEVWLASWLAGYSRTRTCTVWSTASGQARAIDGHVSRPGDHAVHIGSKDLPPNDTCDEGATTQAHRH